MATAPSHVLPARDPRSGHDTRPAGRGLRICIAVVAPVLAAGIAFAGPALTSAIPAASASPATDTSAQPDPTGHLKRTKRHGHHLRIRGHARDRDANNPIRVTIRVDHKRRKSVIADHLRPSTGRHTGFRTRIRIGPGRHRVCAVAHNRGPGHTRKIGCFTVRADWKAKNTAIAELAAKYVGARYVSGGTSPATGFDCSGFVHYVYATAAHIDVEAIAQVQRDGAHSLSKSDARAGDLVFFYSGGYVSHVGIYAGGNDMWAAATPADGLRFQSIYSSDVSFGSYTH